MLMMMQNPSADMNTFLPYMLLDDGSTDMSSMFLMTTMMQNNCQDTNGQMNALLPMLMLSGDDAQNDNLKTILLLQTMSQGKSRLD